MSIKLLADEDLDQNIVRGLLRRMPELDIVLAIDVGLSGKTDSEVLDWAASQYRVLLTHDVTTLLKTAHQRLSDGLVMPGVFAIPQSMAIGQAIEALALIAECSLTGEWDGQVRFLPL